MVFKINSKAIINALADAVKKNIDVKVIVDRKLFLDNENAANLLNSNVPFKIYKSQDKEIMHHKVTLIDNNRVIIGTGNYIEGDFRNNFENIIFVESADIYKQFAKHFHSLWQMDNCYKYKYRKSIEFDLGNIYKGFLSFRGKIILLLLSLIINFILLTL